MCIRRGRGLLANDNPAFTRKSRRIVGVYTRHLRVRYGVDGHLWPRIRAPSAHNGLRIRGILAVEVGI